MSEVIYCSKCGTMTNSDAVFCAQCGAKLLYLGTSSKSMRQASINYSGHTTDNTSQRRAKSGWKTLRFVAGLVGLCSLGVGNELLVAYKTAWRDEAHQYLPLLILCGLVMFASIVTFIVAQRKLKRL